MKSKILNEDHLREDEMDGTVTRVKAFIMNPKNEILLASSNGGVQLVGGHVEEEEEEIDTLKREILEETGIQISNDEINPEPFYEIKHYCKNYFHSGKNKIATISYYIVKTNKEPDASRVKLTKLEQDYAFQVQYIPYDHFAKYVSAFLQNEKEVNRWIAKEILEAFGEMKV